MRAAVTEAFGSIDRVVVHDLPSRSGPGEVLVRVKAAAMNPLDCKLREGKLRLIFRVRPPFVLGFDLAGEVQGVGTGVTHLRPGDTMFGTMCAPAPTRSTRNDFFKKYVVTGSVNSGSGGTSVHRALRRQSRMLR